MKTTYHNVTDDEWEAGEWEGDDMSPLDYWMAANEDAALREQFFQRFLADADFYEGGQQ